MLPSLFTAAASLPPSILGKPESLEHADSPSATIAAQANHVRGADKIEVMLSLSFVSMR
jgi:hypothetical protein